MRSIISKTFGLAAVLCVFPALLGAQDFTLFGERIQTHGFVQQGFIYTANTNNYLTMNTNKGSAAMTDAAFNVSSRLTDKFHVGAQMYYGHLGALRKSVHLDWAVADYRFKRWFGLRGGKVKTVLGLFTDTQDAEFLHTFALLPQAIYPVDLRNSSIAHIGGDAYGDLVTRRYGTISYTFYYGERPNDAEDGLLYTIGDPFTTYTGPMGGGDLRWATPLKGLLVGASYLTQHPVGSNFKTPTSSTRDDARDQTAQYYFQYTTGDLEIDGEYNGHHGVFVSQTARSLQDFFSWYISASYRINKYLTLGSYYSQFIPDKTNPVWSDPSAHIYDQDVTVRVDLTSHWNVKMEGHFMDGVADPHSARGIYIQTNSRGETTKTNILVIRTAVYF
jgi:hypothetical protein